MLPFVLSLSKGRLLLPLRKSYDIHVAYALELAAYCCLNSGHKGCLSAAAPKINGLLLVVVAITRDKAGSRPALASRMLAR